MACMIPRMPAPAARLLSLGEAAVLGDRRVAGRIVTVMRGRSRRGWRPATRPK